MGIYVKPQDQLDILSGAPIEVMLTGRIDPDAPRRLQQTLRPFQGKSIIVNLHSPGGSLIAGIQIGRIIRAAGAFTNIGRGDAKPGECYSSCAFAFLGGTFRYMSKGSVYGVHQASTSAPEMDSLALGQVISASIASYIKDMGVDPALLGLNVKAGPDEIYILNSKELTDLRVVYYGKDSAEWIVDVVDAGTFLMGTQEAYHGTGKFRLFCTGKIYGLMSSYTAGDNARNIARGRWEHSLFINDATYPLPTPHRIEDKGETISAVFKLTGQQLQSMLNSESVGHAMQVDRAAPTFVGYRVSVPPQYKSRFNSYIRNCLRGG